ncbi:hypothetical protein MMPV_000320 [Pyropia vietnamensis]
MEPDPPIPYSYSLHIFVLVLHTVLLPVLLALHVWTPPFARGWRVGIWLVVSQAAQVVGATVFAIAVAPIRTKRISYRKGKVVYLLYGITGATAALTWAGIGVVGWTLLLGYHSPGRFTEDGTWWLRRQWVAIIMGVTGFVTAIVTGGSLWACAWLVPAKVVLVGETSGEQVATTKRATSEEASADVQV